MVFVNVFLPAFAMPHFAEYSAVGAGDAFYGEYGAVGVVAWVHARSKGAWVGILGGNLSVFDEFL